MKNNKKKILAIVLVILVLILGGASVYVATQLSTRKAVAPTAPESKPAASESATPTWSSSCTATGSATANVSVGFSKDAYADESDNSAGSYTKNTEISTIASGGTYVYHMLATNKGVATISGTISDTLTGNNLDQLTFVDSSSVCSFSSSTRVVTCDLGEIAPGKTAGADVRVRVSDDTANSTVITNKAILTYGSATINATNAITITNKVGTTIEGTKTAYENETANTAGKYTLTTEMGTVAKNQTYVYAISLTNTGDATATGVVLKDSLADLSSVTFVDKVSTCTWGATEKLLTCNTTLNPDETKIFSFRVKSSAGVANGDTITNTATVTADNTDSLTLTKDLTVSSVVGCNHTCTSDEECSSGLTCDTTTNKCRLAACLTDTDCVCGTTTTTTTSTTVTKIVTPTKIATTAATPTILPETGILDLPGVAAFGGGLILAVVGILLAL